MGMLGQALSGKELICLRKKSTVCVGGCVGGLSHLPPDPSIARKLLWHPSTYSMLPNAVHVHSHLLLIVERRQDIYSPTLAMRILKFRKTSSRSQRSNTVPLLIFNPTLFSRFFFR